MLSKRVAALEPSIIREMFGRKKPTSLDLSIGEPALDPDPALLDRAWAALRSGPQGYTPNPGLPELREAIARHHAIPGRDRAENVIVTVGSEEAVFVTMFSTLDPGDEVIVPDPGYPAYRGIARLIGAVPVPCPILRENGLVPLAAQLEALITPRTRLIVLNSPSNPFGRIDSAQELEAIAALAERHRIAVLSDEIYRDLYYADAPPSIVDRTENAILVAGLSKSCALTGLRLGYLVADAALVKKATLCHQLMVTCAPRIAQLAALDVFRQPALLRAHVPFYAAARAAVLAAPLPARAGLSVGEGAFYAILDLSAYAVGDPLAFALRLLEEEDVVAVPGIAFGPSGGWFWRLSYAAGAQVATQGLERIARFLARQP